MLPATPRRVLSMLLAGSMAWIAVTGCSVKKVAVRSLGSALASGGGVYAEDDDPELVAAALPFGLKTIEGLLRSDPGNPDLLLAAASGFTQYGTAFVAWEADYVEDADPARADAMRARAKNLLRRARNYGLSGLDALHPGFAGKVRTDPAAALAPVGSAGLPLLYWTAAAWGSGISLAKDDPEMTADLSIVEAMLRRCEAIDGSWGAGTIHDALVALDGGRPAAGGGSLERAKASFDRAVALSDGKRAAPLVTWAETISVGKQRRAEFDELLGRVVALDVDAAPAFRLANLLAQKRARWLLAHADDLFLE